MSIKIVTCTKLINSQNTPKILHEIKKCTNCYYFYYNLLNILSLICTDSGMANINRHSRPRGLERYIWYEDSRQWVVRVAGKVTGKR